MAELNLQSREAKTTNFPKPRTPRWGKRLLEGAKAAGLVIGMSALALQGCGKAHLEVVAPPPPRNIICDSSLGTFFVRPDNMDSIVSSPRDCGQDAMCLNTFPLLALAISQESQ